MLIVLKCLLFIKSVGTVLPVKSDSDVIFVYKVVRDLSSIDHSSIYPICRT